MNPPKVFSSLMPSSSEEDKRAAIKDISNQIDEWTNRNLVMIKILGMTTVINRIGEGFMLSTSVEYRILEKSKS
jgi:hypothetical protein